jgi:ketosteroid isomerase-like protein
MSVSDATKEVLALEQARLDPLNKSDLDAVKELMSDRLVHIHATGAVEDRNQYIDGLRRLPRKTRRDDDICVRLCGNDVAILTGVIVNTLTRAGESAPQDVRLVVTQVAQRESGIWRFVSFHACRL